MKILVTGAAGFIGSHAAQALKATGAEVIGIDNFNDYYDVKQKQANKQLLKQDGIIVHDLDIRSEKASKFILKHKPGAIVHLAAMAGVRYSIEKPLLYFNTNVDGTANILAAAKEIRAHVVFGSSSSVYGQRRNAPFKETDRTDKQISPYAASKAAAELICRTHFLTTGLPVTCLRFFTVYGPRGRPDMAPYKFMKLLLEGKTITRYGDGSSARDYTYVGDIVSGIVAAVDAPNGFQIYNLGNSSPVTLNDFISTLEVVTQKKAKISQAPIPAGDVLLTFADISKAQAELGYSPQTSLREGLEKHYEWFMQSQD